MVGFFHKMGHPIVQENTVEAEEIRELAVYSDVTNIYFSVHDKKQVHLVLETFEKGPELGVQFMDRRLEINLEFLKKRSFIQMKQNTSTLTIYLPRDCADYYHIHSSVGNIRFTDLFFIEGKFKTGAGNIKVEDVDAEKITIESGAGNIRLNRVNTEDLHAVSGAGSIKGRECRGKINIKSGAGNVDFHVDGEDDLSMKSGAGNISVGFSGIANLNAALQVSAGFGNVQTDFPLEGKKPSNLSGVLGNGDKQFIFKTGVGNINLYYP
ncbi:DUF4097 domain-containing protein [Oceanobacillus luteolus]|uniref:DUF4097 domain-containing protein n=1 Tax=Oceanobacillus luteolus TaxID=1274358 RepID=A0ABW4HNV4_9BACI|nr:DUF4097 family beta strand repeat-containing protein [Oceanobacillus luteolus]MCM3740548.1 DUF4097 domain-containing protein [Oceanobacillus luteolus]